MSIALITGSSGLIGSESVRFFCGQGFDVVGVDNNMRQYFFGADGSTHWMTSQLQKECRSFTHVDSDIRDQAALHKLFAKYGTQIKLIIHCAAQPSHDWAAKEPHTDFSINATATLHLLEATRQHCPEAVFIFTSTNKVYGDLPNHLPIVEKELRYELNPTHPWAQHGIDETMSIDQSKHSIFGASKVAADIMTQEYGRYFGMKTTVFRGGCLTGPAHSGAELHGFLAYLVKCQLAGRPYRVYGYKGKQVRDNIHSFDLVQAFWHVFQAPRVAEVYNIGGGQHSNCSLLEAVAMIKNKSGKSLSMTFLDQARQGDHIWWISDVRKFQNHYPHWKYQYDIQKIIGDIVEQCQSQL